MAREKKQKTLQPLTTAQRLSSIVKSCRDVMRKDKGLNGDLDRLPMLTWIMFLKFLDDMEQMAEQESRMAGKRFRPALEAPYRWRDWGGESRRHHRGRINQLREQRGSRPAGRQKRPGDCSPTCVVCRAPTVATGAMSSLRCSRARSPG
jgi:hypothetical protein